MKTLLLSLLLSVSSPWHLLISGIGTSVYIRDLFWENKYIGGFTYYATDAVDPVRIHMDCENWVFHFDSDKVWLLVVPESKVDRIMNIVCKDRK